MGQNNYSYSLSLASAGRGLGEGALMQSAIGEIQLQAYMLSAIADIASVSAPPHPALSPTSWGRG